MMEAMGFSAQDAKGSIDELSKGIDGLPTALDEVVGTTQQLAHEWRPKQIQPS